MNLDRRNWSENLAIAPYYKYQSTYCTCVTSVTSVLCPLSMAACGLNIASTPELCYACTGAADYMLIVGHDKGPWDTIASVMKQQLRKPGAPSGFHFGCAFSTQSTDPPATAGIRDRSDRKSVRQDEPHMYKDANMACFWVEAAKLPFRIPGQLFGFICFIPTCGSPRLKSVCLYSQMC